MILSKPIAIFLIPLMILGGCFFERRSLSQKVRPNVVILTSERGTCSGFHIETARGTYILTAGHCRVLEDENGYIQAKDDDMSAPVLVKVLEESDYSDLLLLEAIPNHRGLKLASSVEMHEMLASFTHGAGMDTYRTDGELIQRKHTDIGVSSIDTPEEAEKCVSKPKYKVVEIPSFFGKMEICAISVDFFVSTVQTVPGSSGGVIVDLQGNVVGVVSGGNDMFTLMIPVDVIREFLVNR